MASVNVCNKCGHRGTKTLDTRRIKKAFRTKIPAVARRRLLCPECSHRITTYEIEQDILKNFIDQIETAEHTLKTFVDFKALFTSIGENTK